MLIKRSDMPTWGKFDIISLQVDAVDGLQAQKPKVVGKRLQPKSTMPSFIRIKPQPKKAKLEVPVAVTSKQQDPAEEVAQKSTILGLVSYSDESDDED